MDKFDLLSTVVYGGCSAKIAPEVLEKLLNDVKFHFPSGFDAKNLLVGMDTSDDAAVYKMNDEQAIIFTTDFFPPMCSDAYTFGQIAATNALSDVYAMGGKVLMALNLIMFPDKRIPLEVLSDILQGGFDKVHEAGAIIGGGHTIDDFPPKYGLAVLGVIHPSKLITNANARVGDVLILTKPIGTGTIIAGKRLGLVYDKNYHIAIDVMKQLNNEVARLMNKFEVKAATDITGFGLLGHALKMAKASSVCLNIEVEKVPFIPQAIDLTEMGCIPGASFRNQSYVNNCHPPHTVNGIHHPAYTAKKVSQIKGGYNKMMLLYDAQTSGGMLIAVPEDKALGLLAELQATYPYSSIIGKAEKLENEYIREV